jgi:voltage-gated potassium channel Kch
MNSLFSAPQVFADSANDVSHLHNILRDRCQRPHDAPLPQLAFLCDRYLKRFDKRMRIYQKRGGGRGGVAAADFRSHWASRLGAFLNNPFASRLSFAYYCVVLLLVVGSCVSLVLQTLPEYNPVVFPDQQDHWDATELTFGGLLFADWILRFVAVVLEPCRHGSRLAKILRFLRRPSTILDFCASTVPALLTLGGDANSVFQIFTLLRVFRIFFSLRHFDAFEDLEETIRNSLPSLTGPLIALTVVLIGISSLVYTMEAGTYSEESLAFMVRRTDCEMTAAFDLGMERCFRVESKFLSVVHTMWYTLITFLTVGYGDLVPLTAFGRALGALSIVVGMLFMAMPIAIVGTNFTFTVNRLRTERACVTRMLADAKELQTLQDDMASVAREFEDDIALPSVGLLRFLRLNLRKKQVNVNEPSRTVIYFVDVYLSRVVARFLDDENGGLVSELAMRAREQRRPYTLRLELVPPAALTSSAAFPRVVLPLNVPLVLGVGSGPHVGFRIPVRVLAQWAQTAAVLAAPSDTPPDGRVVTYLPFVSDVHGFVTLVNYGGMAEGLTAMGTDPHGVRLVDLRLRECANVNRAGYLFFAGSVPGAPQPALMQQFHVKLTFGAPFRALHRLSLVENGFDTSVIRSPGQFSL